MAVHPARGRPAPACGRGPAAAADQRRSWPTWSSPTCRAGWPRRCWTWPRASATNGGRHPGQPRPDPGGARPARRRLAGDGEQGAGRLRRARLDPAAAKSGCCSIRPAAQAGQLRARSPAAAPAPAGGRGSTRGSYQVVQLGLDRQLGGRPERRGPLGVDPATISAAVRVRRRPARPAPGPAAGPMGQVVVEHLGRLGPARAVAGQHRSSASPASSRSRRSEPR